MINRALLAAIAGLSVAGPAWAAGGSIQLSYLPVATLDIPDADIEGDGDGFSLRLKAFSGDRFFGYFEHTARSFDVDGFDSDLDADTTRIGAGAAFAAGASTVWVGANLERLDTGTEFDGVGFRGGISTPLNRTLMAYGELGAYLVTGSDGGFDSDIVGVDIVVGGLIHFDDRVGAFIDYRYQSLTETFDDGFFADDIDYDVGELRIGINISF